MVAKNWMIDEVTTVRGVQHVVVATSDGIATARSEETGQDAAERLAATCAGLFSLGSSVAREFGPGDHVDQVMVDFGEGFLFVRQAGDGSRLAVLTDRSVDPRVIAQQMQAQVLKIGQGNLATPSRHSTAP